MEDRKRLTKAKERQFVQNCIAEFSEPSINVDNREKVKKMLAWSYLPNGISIVTAAFFVVYLLQSYTLWVQIVLGILLFVVAASLEFGKRLTISECANNYFRHQKLHGLLVGGILVLCVASMSASYIGGNKLVVSTATPPPSSKNSKIDSLTALVDTLNVSIAKQEGTTWKGKVTRDANKNLNKLYDDRKQFNASIQLLEAKDLAKYERLLADHKGKIEGFGVVLGIIAILADGFLFALLWNIKKLKYEVVLVLKERRKEVNPAEKHDQREKSTSSVNVQGDIIGDFGQISENQRRPIGFYIDRNGERNILTVTTTEEKVKPKIIESEKLRTCKNCNKVFEYKHWNAQYCSDDCRWEAWRKRKKSKQKKND